MVIAMRMIRVRYLVLFLSVVVLLSGTALGAAVQNSFGMVNVTEVDFSAADGSNIHSTLQTPVYASGSNRLPGVVVIHGSLQSKEWLMAFGIELARRGFVVLTIDANGHGNSDRGTGSGAAALDYIASLDYVDSTQIGIVGHSMGGGIARLAINESSVVVNAFVVVGSGISWANTTYPHNVLVAVGDFDSLSSYPRNLTLLEGVFGVTDIEPGVVYGSFDEGTAREIVIARTNHLFETIDPTIVSETVDWMRNSLKGGVEDEHWLPKGNLVYGWWLVGGFFSTLGAVLSVFPLLTILIGLKPFSVLKRGEQEPYVNTASRKEYLVRGAVYGVIGVAGFYPFLAIGTLLQAVIPFPQVQGLPIIMWILGTALISRLVLPRILSRQEDPGAVWRELRRIGPGAGGFARGFLRTLLLGGLVIVWLYGWTLLVDLGFALDLRAFLPGMNDLTVSRALMFPLYAIVFFLYALVEGMWLMGALRTRARTPWTRGMIVWAIEAVFIKCIPFVLLISIELGGGLLLGVPLIPGIIGYSFLFFYAFVPWFGVASIVTVWCYRETGTFYLGAIINGLLFGWMIATILAFT